MPANHEHFMRMAIEEAAKGGSEGNSAVGSVIVRDGNIVAVGRNLVTSTNDPTAHAETVALREAGSAQGDPDMSGCTLYTTFQPCPMCSGALIVSGVATVVMGARPNPGEGRYSPYSMEQLFVQAGSKMRSLIGVLVRECLEVRQEWDAKNASGR